MDTPRCHPPEPMRGAKEAQDAPNSLKEDQRRVLNELAPPPRGFPVKRVGAESALIQQPPERSARLDNLKTEEKGTAQ